LVKAGEEALRSSASTEALNYYQEGLKLYLKKYGEAGDPEKLAVFERNIALALFNKGRYENAVQYFDSVLERLRYVAIRKAIYICSYGTITFNLAKLPWLQIRDPAMEHDFRLAIFTSK